MLNYAYAVLFSQVKIGLISQGFDPAIGLLHTKTKYRDALVFDHMEPLRPIIDRDILKLILGHKLLVSHFTISTQGHCHLNPQLARNICLRVMACCS